MLSSRTAQTLLNCGKELKRRREESADETLSEGGKKDCKWVVLGPEVEQPVFEDSESSYSVQERETDFAKDTSDTTSHSSDEDVEFTVAYSDSSNKGKGSDSTSSGSKTFKKLEIASVIIFEDLGLLAGSSDSDIDSDSELPQADFWTCRQCGATKNNPRFGVCERCFKARRSYLPPRPVRKKMRKRNGAVPRTSNPPIADDCTQTSTQASSSQPSVSSSQTSQNSEDGKCKVCIVNLTDGIFIHGKSAHSFACYRCSRRMYKDNKRCPICNQRVNNVVQLFR